jgi:hypothetical protein
MLAHLSVHVGKDVASIITAYALGTSEMLLCAFSARKAQELSGLDEVSLVDIYSGEVVLSVEGNELHDFLVVDVSPDTALGKTLNSKAAGLWAVMAIDYGVYVYNLIDARYHLDCYPPACVCWHATLSRLLMHSALSVRSISRVRLQTAVSVRLKSAHSAFGYSGI